MLFGHVRTMLNSARLKGEYESLQHGLWAECTNTAMKLANIVAPSNKSLPHFQFFKTNPTFVSDLRVFGEIDIVNDAAPLHSKLANQGEHGMFIGYANNHAHGTLKMFNLKTHCIWMTCAIHWATANIVKYDELKNNPLQKKHNDNNDDDDDIIITQTHVPTPNQANNDDNDPFNNNDNADDC